MHQTHRLHRHCRHLFHPLHQHRIDRQGHHRLHLHLILVLHQHLECHRYLNQYQDSQGYRHRLYHQALTCQECHHHLNLHPDYQAFRHRLYLLVPQG